MNYLRFAPTALSLGLLLAVGACGNAALPSVSTSLKAPLTGASEVPMVMTDASGKLDASLALGSNVLTWSITYSGLSGPVTGAHFHGPATSATNAVVVLPISAPLASPILGSATLTAEQAAELTAGKWYVNLHTAANPDGEIRGQVELGS
jgi:hypothetical protein